MGFCLPLPQGREARACLEQKDLPLPKLKSEPKKCLKENEEIKENETLASSFLVSLGVVGGPTDPLDCFNELISSTENQESYLVLLENVKLAISKYKSKEEKNLPSDQMKETSSSTNEKIEKEQKQEQDQVDNKNKDNVLKIEDNEAKPELSLNKQEEKDSKVEQEVKKNMDSKEKNKDIVCDEIFGEFLREHSEIVIPKFYQSLIMFVKNYRECLNEYGYSKLSTLKENSISKINEEQSDTQGNETKLSEEDTDKMEFCKAHNGENAPEVSNDFIKNFLPKYCSNLDLNLSIKMTNYFCNWLYKNKYTHSKLTLLK